MGRGSSWVALAALCLIYFVNVFTRMQFSMLASHWGETFQMSESQQGGVPLFLSAGFGISLFLSQYLSSKIGYKKTVYSLSLLSGIWLMLFPHVESLSSLRLHLFLFGCLSGFFLPASIPFITALFPKNVLGKVMGSFTSVQTLAMVATPLMAHVNLIVPLGATLAVASVALFFNRSDVSEAELPPSREFLISFTRQKLFWILLIFQILATGLNIGVYVACPICFSADPQVHYFLTLSRVLGVVTPFLAGMWIDRAGIRHVLLRVSAFSGFATAALGVVPASFAGYILCLQGPLAIAMMSTVYLAIAHCSVPERRAAVLSLFSCFSFLLGAGAIPQALAAIGEMSMPRGGFIGVGLIACGASFLFLKSQVLSKVFSPGEPT